MQQAISPQFGDMALPITVLYALRTELNYWVLS